MRFLDGWATESSVIRNDDGTLIWRFQVGLRLLDGPATWIAIELPDKGWGMDRAREAAVAIALLRSNGVVM